MNDGDDGEEAGGMTEVTEKIERNHLELFGIASFVAKKRRVLGWMYWGRRLAPGEKWSHNRSSSLTNHYSTVQPGPGNDIADLGYCEQTRAGGARCMVSKMPTKRTDMAIYRSRGSQADLWEGFDRNRRFSAHERKRNTDSFARRHISPVSEDQGGRLGYSAE